MQGYGGFEHNRQSLRIVEVLEERYPGFDGLNLTWETREGIIKHSARSSCACIDAQEYFPEVPPPLEAQIIDLADEIAYNNHDIDDGLKAGYITLDELQTVPLWKITFSEIIQKYPGLDPTRSVYQTISALIGKLIADVVATTQANITSRGIKTEKDVRQQVGRVISFSSEIQEQNQILKSFLKERLYRHHKVERMRIKVERILSMIFESYLKTPSLLPAEYHKKFEQFGLERTIVIWWQA